ncbi:hypothetical protein BS17DRAFT_807439 [Gyrodon lividus]|nr:hypothetical protein BS17DRAFT_807439 [Gyrodon lividus]
MAARLALTTCRSRVFHACVWPTVGCRSYALSAVKSNQKSSASQAPTSPRNASPSVKPTAAPAKEKAKGTESKTASGTLDMDLELQQLENMKRLPKIVSTTDVWGSELANLDVEIPYDLRLMFRSLRAEPKFTRRKFTNLWFSIKHNTRNWMKNSFSMFTVARANAFPGLDVKPGFSTWRRITDIQSNSRDSLLAPFRQVALDTYRNMNVAVVRANENMMKEVTSGRFQERTLKAMRRREKGQFWTWDIVSDVSESALFPKTKDRRAPTPVDVVSIRAAEVYLAKEEPLQGNRLVIQALVKFDTTHKIGIVDKRGQPVDSELTSPRRVVQYLLLEKVGWYDTPWKVKDQMYKI